jgi:hypothetical protein
MAHGGTLSNMHLPDNYAETIVHYLDSPNSIYHYFKQQKRKNDDGVYGVVGTIKGVNNLINILSQDRFDEYDHYISTYSYLSTVPAKHYIGGEQVDTSSVQVNKIYFDIDPEENQADALDKLEHLREFQSIIPCRMYATGRGIQLFIDLDRNISLRDADYYQRGLDAKFSLGADKHVPISNRRVFRLPYTRNSRNNRWCIPISPKLTARDIRNIQSYDSIWKSYFILKKFVNPDSLLQYVPDTIVKQEDNISASTYTRSLETLSEYVANRAR